ncbi:replication initiation protein [Jannaschia aquimarina]|uniref:Initiator Replication protein n=1 Tax=Jannaschia aquimarina TaxID=935700 RepID=A0A0D1EFS5_9RHOB|nr:replication initiation protein [Jannaschia aquimarina]KIT14720.1 Initiator Replication protein [Jannaschia aquimarina]SNT44176.1 Initiator Replication protein [Jannaschia aquimarina]
MNTDQAALSLFEEHELSGIQPTGNPWIMDAHDPATVPVPLQVVITSVEGPYTERDRKLWTFLLHVAFEELGQKGGHSVAIKDINTVFRSLGGQHDTAWIWESAKRLTRTIVEFEVTFGDERFDTVTSIFSASVPRKGKRGSDLHFWFPEPLIPIIREPLRFARLRVHFLIKLSGKYAVTLYEILEGFANRRDGECRVTIEELRQWLKVPEGSYDDWRDFRKRVLHPAIKQINDDPLGAGFTVGYEPIRKGRKIGEIVFQLTKSTDRIRTEQTIRAAKDSKARVADLKAKGRPVLTSGAIAAADRETRHTLDMADVERQFWEHWEAKGKPEFTKGVAQAFLGFTKTKYRQSLGR